MNQIEAQMVDILAELNRKYSAIGVKAEFEAEGTRTEELIRLKEICLAAKMSLTLKVGGCEAVRDMYDARTVGVNYLVAPMVETPFALQKYLRAINVAFPPDEQEKVEFLVNIETLQSARNLSGMLALPEIDRLDGIVLGRSDLTASMGLGKKAVDSPEVFQVAREVLSQAKQKKLTCVIGGTITADSLDFMRKLPCGLLDRFETRKISFACPQALGARAAEGIDLGLEFELLWLRNKKNYYKAISEEDDKRIAAIKERMKNK
jgi:hypothetical protein